MSDSLPYRIAVLCYLFDEQGRVLLLHRRKPPNQDLYSPIGGKLEQDVGESPTACAIREIREEAGLELTPGDLHLTGIVSESDYDDQTHWLMFLYEVLAPTPVTHSMSCDEGQLDWHRIEAIDQLPIPATDKRVIWPLFWLYRRRFFTAHINCQGGILNWRVEQPYNDVGIDVFQS